VRRKQSIAASGVALFLAFAVIDNTHVMAASADSAPVYTVMNTSEQLPDGVYFRNSPNWADTSRTTGLGVFKNEQVKLECYVSGQAIGQFNDSLWYWVLDITRPTNDGASNEGMLNAHYIDDKQKANVVDAGVPACVNNRPPAPAPVTTAPAAPPSTRAAPTTAPPTSQPRQPAPATPAPTLPTNVRRVVNADGGVYWRSGPDWSLAIQTAGHGVYNDDYVFLECYVRGGTVPPNNNNPLWYLASIYSGKGVGQGYVNDHFLDTGINQPNHVVGGVPVCPVAGAGGGSGNSGGGLPTYSLPPPLPQPPTVQSPRKQVGPNPTVVNGIPLGSARDDWHKWGGCVVRDYDGPGKEWVIVVQTTPNAYLIVRNGMLFGWFDNKGAPGSLGCPTRNEDVQGSDGASHVSWITQAFQGGTLYWDTGMNHAVVISAPVLAAIRWAWNCLPNSACNYTTSVNGYSTTFLNYKDYCLAFVYDAYALGAGVQPRGGPTGDTASAYQVDRELNWY
jgi:hypothetical protein